MSNINDALKMKGRLQIHVNDELVQEVDNLVVTAGKGYVASRMKDTTATAMSHMAIGSGSTAAAANNTALGNELGRVALTSTTVSGAVTEAGILNASSSGTMLCRTVFSVVNKGSADSMTVTWTVTVS